MTFFAKGTFFACKTVIDGKEVRRDKETQVPQNLGYFDLDTSVKETLVT